MARVHDGIEGGADFDAEPMAGAHKCLTASMAAEDLKAYYFESVAAQPGQSTGSTPLANWFWTQTRAASMIKSVREICLAITDDEFQILGNLLLVPRSQL